MGTKNQKRARAAAQQRAQDQFANVPHSFVFHRGRVGRSLQQLILDVRRVMEPFTASTLQVRKKNSLKDFVAVAGPLGVTHFLVFTKSPTNVNFKLVRLPGGPTLTFKVTQYSLIKDVVSSLKHHRMHEQQFTHHPAPGAQQLRAAADARQADGHHVPEHVPLHQRAQGQPQRHQAVPADQLQRGHPAPGLPALQPEGGACGASKASRSCCRRSSPT
ncbi:unnamed protein product [Lepidochelys kempii]